MYYVVLYLYSMYCMYLNPTHRVANKFVSLSLSLTFSPKVVWRLGRTNIDGLAANYELVVALKCVYAAFNNNY